MKVITEFSDQLRNQHTYVNVKIVQENGVVRDEYKMTLNDYLAEISASIDKQKIETPILPRNCIKLLSDPVTSSYDVYIEVPKAIWDIQYHGKKFKLGFPRMLFLYKVEGKKIKDLEVFALKGKMRVTEDTEIFQFPYTNVNTSGRVCMGKNVFPAIQSISQLETMHSFFFSAPFGDDFGTKLTNHWSMGKVFLELENKEFPEELLITSKLTFGEMLEKKDSFY